MEFIISCITSLAGKAEISAISYHHLSLVFVKYLKVIGETDCQT